MISQEGFDTRICAFKWVGYKIGNTTDITSLQLNGSKYPPLVIPAFGSINLYIPRLKDIYSDIASFYLSVNDKSIGEAKIRTNTHGNSFVLIEVGDMCVLVKLNKLNSESLNKRFLTSVYNDDNGQPKLWKLPENVEIV